MHGPKRVAIFCVLTTLLPIFLLIIPLYLRHNLYADVVYAVTESDVLEISDGVSTIFCASHTLHMNGTFNAFQMGHKPEITSSRKHIRLKKSMILPDDTLEYWGFYLLRGASVALSVCSRFPGASILVVKGERTLPTCGMLDHNKNKARTQGVFLPEAHNQVKITFESNAREITHSDEFTKMITPNNYLINDKKNDLKKDFFHAPVDQHISDVHVKDYDEMKKIRHGKNRKKEHDRKSSKEIVVKNNSRQRRDTRKNLLINNDEDKQKRKMKLEKLRRLLNSPGADDSAEEDDLKLKIVQSHRHKRVKRNQEPMKPPALLDQGIKHGGNALRNLTGEDSSVSSFEEGLFQCYEGHVLVSQEFDPSDLCTDVSYLENGKSMQSRHNVTEDGYYYYIFYSDNDIVSNDIHAIFDIFKPTFQYENVTKSCINDTECTFPLSIMSSDRVIVEIPTKDGIDHEADDTSLLISVCHPRMGVYLIFPIAVLFLILSCAFL